jgi:hypothetical protein
MFQTDHAKPKVFVAPSEVIKTAVRFAQRPDVAQEHVHHQHKPETRRQRKLRNREFGTGLLELGCREIGLQRSTPSLSRKRPRSNHFGSICS